MAPKTIKIRRANIRDVKKIVRLINGYARQGKMLVRKEADIVLNLRDYFVAVQPRKKKILGCVGLHIYTDRLSELRSLAVRPQASGLGIGRRLVRRCIKEARDLGVPKVFTLTYIADFFLRLGFSNSNKELLPQKIWEDCAKCSKRNNCTENCLAYQVK